MDSVEVELWARAQAPGARRRCPAGTDGPRRHPTAQVTSVLDLPRRLPAAWALHITGGRGIAIGPATAGRHGPPRASDPCPPLASGFCYHRARSHGAHFFHPQLSRTQEASRVVYVACQVPICAAENERTPRSRSADTKFL